MSLRHLIKKLGLLKSTIVIIIFVVVVSEFASILVMVATGGVSIRGLIVALAVPGLLGGITSFLFLRAFYLLEKSEDKLRKMSVTDELTQVNNRRYFIELGQIELERMKRFHKAFSLIMIDVDDFKHINDNFGHAGGDAVLKSLSQTCTTLSRKIDVFARFGGDEFIFLLPECGTKQARQFAERIRETLQQNPVENNGHKIPFTVSVGVKTAQPNADSLESIINQADFAMYDAKEQGKNRISTKAKSPRG